MMVSAHVQRVEAVGRVDREAAGAVGRDGRLVVGADAQVVARHAHLAAVDAEHLARHRQLEHRRRAGTRGRRPGGCGSWQDLSEHRQSCHSWPEPATAHHAYMDFVERQHLIHQYRDGYRAVTAALANLTDAELDKRPATAPGRPVRSSTTSPTARPPRPSACASSSPRTTPVIQAYDEALYATRAPLRPSDRVVAASAAGRPPGDRRPAGRPRASRMGARRRSFRERSLLRRDLAARSTPPMPMTTPTRSGVPAKGESDVQGVLRPPRHRGAARRGTTSSRWPTAPTEWRCNGSATAANTAGSTSAHRHTSVAA